MLVASTHHRAVVGDCGDCNTAHSLLPHPAAGARGCCGGWGCRAAQRWVVGGCVSEFCWTTRWKHGLVSIGPFPQTPPPFPLLVSVRELAVGSRDGNCRGRRLLPGVVQPLAPADVTRPVHALRRASRLRVRVLIVTTVSLIWQYAEARRQLIPLSHKLAHLPADVLKTLEHEESMCVPLLSHSCLHTLAAQLPCRCLPSTLVL